MSNYRKERNLIIIDLDGVNGDYRLDINTGIYYGVKGMPIKTCPNKATVRRLFSTWGEGSTNLSSVIHHLFDNCSHTSQYVRYVKIMQGADKVDALGLPNLSVYNDQYIYLGDNIKALAVWLKDHDANNFSFSSFKTWCEFEKVRSSLGSIGSTLTAEQYSALNKQRDDLTIEELGVCAYYLNRGKLWEYHNGQVGNLVYYIELCRLLGKKPEKVNNFMREYCETKKSYELNKTEFDNKKIALNYARHAKAWEFAYGNYVVSIPKCGQDIVTEGREMHHCVGSYVNRVVEGSTYICFIRHKDTPNECYITCQVHSDGSLGQYFLAYDRHISSDEDIEFKEAFRNHLSAVWG